MSDVGHRRRAVNWYVYAPLPVLIMHDVLWPYGRRDLYYAPEQIPEEFRQPHDQQGMLAGQSELVKGRGGEP